MSLPSNPSTGRNDTLRRLIDREARVLGFDRTGVVSADGHDDLEPRLSAFLDAGHHGTMDWMRETAERRANPKTLWADTKSIVFLSMNYGPETNPLSGLDKRERGLVSVYARNRDYHDVIKGRLKTLASKLIAGCKRLGWSDENEINAKVFVDTAPVMEKPLAARAGLGWQGKHTNLVSRDFGSWLFLGSIFTNVQITPDKEEADHCGSCRSCLDICPTDAFPAPYQLDARRCISYLTIEHKGSIPLEYRKAMGNRIYGCDDCLAICPWNKFAKQASEAKLATPVGKDPSELPMLADLLREDDAKFRARFSGSAVKRIGWKRFIRNCLIAAGNSADERLLPVVADHLACEDGVVREAAQWARAELENGGHTK